MHATRPAWTTIRPRPLALAALSGVLWATLPGSAEEPAAPKKPAVSTTRTTPSTPGVPSVSTPETSSLEMSRDLPFLSRIADSNLFTGLYEFNDGADNELFGARAGVDMALTNRIFLEASYQHEPDLQQQNGFVGIWASIPLRDRKAPSASSAPAPERTLASSLAGSGEVSPSRMRTHRKPEGEHRDGIFARLLPVSGRAVTEPPPAAAPAATPSPATAAPAPAEKPAQRGFFRELLHRVRH
jgi:hypothetical protein